MSNLSQRTMRAGVVVGVVGVLAIFFTAGIVERAGFNLVNTPALSNILAALWQVITTGFLPFSAALISASLVMRHMEHEKRQPTHNSEESHPRS